MNKCRMHDLLLAHSDCALLWQKRARRPAVLTDSGDLDELHKVLMLSKREAERASRHASQASQDRHSSQDAPPKGAKPAAVSGKLLKEAVRPLAHINRRAE